MSFHSLDKLYGEYVKRFNRFFRGSEEFGNMTLNMYDYIWMVYVNGSATATELAAELGVQKSSVSAMVENLQRNGYLERVPVETDRRSARLCLTGKALDLVSREDAFYAQYVAELKEYLEKDEAVEFDRLLEKIAAGLKRHEKE